METLSDLKSHGEPGAVVYLADCVELMRLMPASCVDMVFADPPYRLSGGGVTVRSGRVAPVDKGEWDRSRGFGKDREVSVQRSGVLSVEAVTLVRVRRTDPYGPPFNVRGFNAQPSWPNHSIATKKTLAVVTSR